MSRESALRGLAARSANMELQIFVVALLVQSTSGGDLVELLDNLTTMIRRRLRLKDRVRAVTGEGRMQAIALAVLPILLLFGIVYLAPELRRGTFRATLAIARRRRRPGARRVLDSPDRQF